MRFETSQHMKMGQTMRMAPRMIQSMEILQMPLAELEERIEQELESNPTLELMDGSGEPPVETDGGGREAEVDYEGALKLDTEGGASDFARLDSYEESNPDAAENEYESGDAARGEGEPVDRYDRIERDRSMGEYVERATSGDTDPKMEAMAAAPARGASLMDQLRGQWALVDVDSVLRAPGELIIAFIDRRACARGRGVTGRFAESALLRRAADGGHARAGVGGGATLPRARGRGRPHAGRVSAAATRRTRRSGGGPGLERQDVRGRQGARASPPRGPDAESPAPRGRTHGALARRTQVRARAAAADESLSGAAAGGGVGASHRARRGGGIRRRPGSVRGVSQRPPHVQRADRQTLLRVIEAVIAKQRDFFDYGPQALRPLPMQAVAEELGIHVATVSRAVAEKYLATPRGVLPLRKFFSGGVQTKAAAETGEGGGEDMAWEAVKAALQELVDAEDKKSPLSDEALAEALKAKGIEIARRTVAKYREQLGIPAKRLRKTF
jgi:RNA polymerase sigma-54 factor